MKKKIGVILLLAVTSSNAAAAWINVGGNDMHQWEKGRWWMR
jgi:hypothetical protein